MKSFGSLPDEALCSPTYTQTISKPARVPVIVTPKKSTETQIRSQQCCEAGSVHGAWQHHGVLSASLIVLLH